jgi:precorrin-6Y C5,15-methyltransferase (decarboxylating)
MAMRARYGRVYAIEHNPGALSLLEQNKRKLGLANLEVVSGSAPAILETLPAPDRVFIGGSSGQMEGIIKAVLRKNPQARLVINAVTLETLSQAVLLLKQLSFQDVETVQVAISRSVKAGDHTFMKAENPVYIISGWGNNEATHGL